MHAFLFLGVSGAILLGVWLPQLIRRAPLSLPMIAVAAGYLLPVLPHVTEPLRHFGEWLEIGATLGLVAAVFAAGLSIDRAFGIRHWASTWRLLGVAMPLTIAMVAALGHFMLALPLGVAILLAAMVAPTDPVLASEVQVGPPGSGKSGPVTFGLTSEAGLNDGLALPFVVLGISLMEGSITTVGDLAEWAAVDLVARTLAGVAVGWALAWLLRRLQSALPEAYRLRQSSSGAAGIGAALLAYGLCELLGANGLVAVFANAVAARRLGVELRFSRRLAHAALEIEHLVMVALMLFFGFALSHGLLGSIGFPELAFVLLVLLVVRHIATQAAFLGSRQNGRVRLVLGFFGIRGISTIYYMVHAVRRVPEGTEEAYLSVAALTVLLSVVLYGTSTGFVLDRLPDEERAP